MEARAETIVDLSADLLRELAGTRPEQGQVLSLYLDLDPAEFALEGVVSPDEGYADGVAPWRCSAAAPPGCFARCG